MIDVVGPRRRCSRRSRRGCADEDREADGQEADLERDAGAVDDPAELVADVAVESHEVLRLVGRAAERGGCTAPPALHARSRRCRASTVRVEGRDQRRRRSPTKTRRAEERQADDGGPLAQDVARRVAPEAGELRRGERDDRFVEQSAASTVIEPDPRIEERVGDVDDQVDHHVDRRR